MPVNVTFIACLKTNQKPRTAANMISVIISFLEKEIYFPEHSESICCTVIQLDLRL